MQSEKIYKFELLLAFFLAVHLEKPIAPYIYEIDDWLQTMILNIVDDYKKLHQHDQFGRSDSFSPSKKSKKEEDEKEDKSIISIKTK